MNALDRCFYVMRKTFVFESHGIEYVDPSIVTPMVIYTISYIPWNLR